MGYDCPLCNEEGMEEVEHCPTPEDFRDNTHRCTNDDCRVCCFPNND